MKDKGYNPFKMIGSWIGGLITFIIFTGNFVTQNCVGNIVWGTSCTRDWGLIFSSRWLGFIIPNTDMGESFFLMVIVWIILLFVFAIGFLIGWGVTALVRWIRGVL